MYGVIAADTRNYLKYSGEEVRTMTPAAGGTMLPSVDSNGSIQTSLEQVEIEVAPVENPLFTAYDWTFNPSCDFYSVMCANHT